MYTKKRKFPFKRRSSLPLKRKSLSLGSPFVEPMDIVATTKQVRRTNWNTGPTRDELKYLDTNFASYGGGTTGSVTLINGVASGSTQITREGRQCYWKTVQVNGFLDPHANQLEERCDVYVIYDKQPGAAVPALTDLFVQAIGGSPLNLNYRDRFSVIVHKSFVLGLIDGTNYYSTIPNTQKISIYKRVNLKTTFKGDSNAIGDISTGALYLVVVGSQATYYASPYVNVRLRFAEK